MNPWEDPDELGRRLAAARAYHRETLAQYANRIGKSGRTIQNMEAGLVGSIGKTPEARKHTAELAVRHGAPPEFFGLDELQGITRTDLEDLLAEQQQEQDSSSADPPPRPDEGEGD